MPSNLSKADARHTLGESTSKTSTTKTKRTSPYDSNFEQYLIDNRVYPDDYDFSDGREPPRPSNENEILSNLRQPRASLSPSRYPESEFRAFKQRNSRAINEDAVMGDVFPSIQGTATIPSAKNLVFANFKPFPYGNLVDAKPDFRDGLRPADINIRVREKLGSYIIPALQGQAPALPNFFTKVKGPDGSGAVAKRQACHDGVLGERGICKYIAFETDDSQTVYDNNAHTITSTYHSASGTLQIYTIHTDRPAHRKDSPEYYMTQLGGWALTGSVNQFRGGTGAFRNARDWAKSQRDQQIAIANSRESGTSEETPTLQPSTNNMSQSTMDLDASQSETSADEAFSVPKPWFQPFPQASEKRTREAVY